MYKAGLQNSAISRTSIGYEVKRLEESLPVVLKILKDEYIAATKDIKSLPKS